MEHARAVVIPAASEVILRDVVLTPAGNNDVTIETLFTSISAGTERMLLAGRMPHPMLQFPVIPGYETVGRIIATGSNVPGEMLDKMVYVGGARCYEGVNPAWGGQSSHLHADYTRVVTLEGMDATHGVLLALAATALHGVDIAGDITGKRVLVLGQGPVGQIAARIALARGAEVVVVDRVASRLALAQASQIIDVSVQSLAEQKIAPCEVIIEASGSMAALTSTLSALANNGRVVLLGYYDEIQLPYMPLFLKQAQLLTAKEWAPGDLQRCRDMIVSGDLDVAPLLTHIQHIDNLQAAYHVALSDLDCLKLLLTW